MAIPSGTGTEALRVGRWDTQSTDVTSFDFAAGNPTVGDETDTVPANHIITLIFASWCAVGSGAETFRFWGTMDSKYIFILVDQALAAFDTFIWNTKVVLIGGDFLKTTTASTADVDVHYSYLDQDWS
jgi:hypothetical protein